MRLYKNQTDWKKLATSQHTGSFFFFLEQEAAVAPKKDFFVLPLSRKSRRGTRQKVTRIPVGQQSSTRLWPGFGRVGGPEAYARLLDKRHTHSGPIDH